MEGMYRQRENKNQKKNMRDAITRNGENDKRLRKGI